MAGMDSLTQSMPNPVGGAGGGVGGKKTPGASPAAKQEMAQAVQKALGGNAPGPQGPQPGKGPGGAAGQPGGPGQSSKPGGGGAFGMSPPDQGGSQGGAKKGATESYDPEKQRQVFMRMMVAQMEHQDPLNPVKGTEFTSQLAQFTGVEQQIRSNEHLDQLTSSKDQQQRWNAMSLLGRDVVLDRNSLQLGESPGKQQFQFQVDAPAQVKAQVTDAKGNVVKEIDLGKRETGSHKATWDGTNSEGKPVGPGEYTIRAAPARGEGQPFQTQVQATVQEVNFGKSGVQLGIGQGQSVAFDRIQTVSQ
jgi:flagellar basal-body rod modification protein FlgD